MDVSLASEGLQRLLSRVQDGGVEVLSLSELAVLRRCTVDTASIATQTVRSALTEATLLADLKRKTQQAEAEAADREKCLKDRRECGHKSNWHKRKWAICNTIALHITRLSVRFIPTPFFWAIQSIYPGAAH
jgi:hypothetical protein